MLYRKSVGRSMHAKAIEEVNDVSVRRLSLEGNTELG